MNKVRNCAEIGPCMRKIINRLLENDKLVNLLYYEDKDPLNQTPLTQEQKIKDVYQKRIKVVPIINPQYDAKSSISVMAVRSTELENNNFIGLNINVEIFVPITQWAIKDENLRPYAIMGAIQESLNDKVINGIGRLKGGDFDYNFTSDEMTSFIQYFRIVAYD